LGQLPIAIIGNTCSADVQVVAVHTLSRYSAVKSKLIMLLLLKQVWPGSWNPIYWWDKGYMLYIF